MTLMFVWAATAAVVGSLVQSVLGFGMMLTAVPLMLLGGVSVSVAIPVCLGAAAVQTVTSLLRQHRRGELTVRPTLCRAMRLAPLQWGGIGVGAWVLHALVDVSPDLVNRCVSAVVLVLVIVLLVNQLGNSKPIDQRWGAAAVGASGLLAGFSGAGGPPLVLFAFRQHWTMAEIRSFLWVQFLIGVVGVVTMFTVLRGAESLWSALLGVALGPAVVVGVLVGGAVTARLSETFSKGMGLVLLMALAISGVAVPAQ